MKKVIRFFWVFLIAAFLSVGGLLLALFLPPYEQTQVWVDRLAKDGHMQSFTQPLFHSLTWPMRLAGLAVMATGALMLVFRPQSQRLLQRIVRYLAASARRLAADARELFAALLRQVRGMDGRLAALVSALTLLAFGLRWIFVSRPMLHDEAYTFEEFAAYSVRFITSNYHLPNNHIFHTLLVHFATRLLGLQPWVVRLPALLSGVLLVPAMYLLARRLYSLPVALLAATLVAVYPPLIDYSTNARGYTLVALITLLLFLLGTFVQKHRNRAAWVLVVILSALGFYTVPVFLYPFGFFLTWLFLSALAGDFGLEYGSRWVLIRYLVAAGAATVLLTGLLYFPIIRTSGIRAIIDNSYVLPLSWNEFRQIAISRMQDTWQEWAANIPLIGPVFILGLCLYLVFHPRTTRQRIPLILAAVAWIVPILYIQKPNPWARLWLFLLPFVLTWTAAGYLALFQTARPAPPLERNGAVRPASPLGRDGTVRWPWLGSRYARHTSLTGWIAGAAILACLVAGIVRGAVLAPSLSARSQDESAVMLVKNQLQTEDVFVVAPPDDSVVWYYAHLHGIPPTAYRSIKNRPFSTAIVLVDEAFQQTLSSVIEARGPDLGFFDMRTAHVLGRSGSVAVYQVSPFPGIVNKAYGLQ